MATTKSNLITNEEASPPVLNSVAKQGGRMRVMCDTFEVTQADSDTDGDIIRLCRLPSHAVIQSIKLWMDDHGGTATVNCGLYATDADTATDEDVFATVFDSGGQVTTGSELLGEAASATSIASFSKKLYEWLATPLTTDPQIFYDVCLTMQGVATGAWTCSFIVQYTID